MSDATPNWQSAPPWETIRIPASKLPAGSGKLLQVVRDLDVTRAPRYAAGEGKTYCNVFVTDVITAMGFEPGHWLTPEGEPALQGKGVEQSANMLCRWLMRQGAAKGWVLCDEVTARDAAARGHLVVVAYDSGGKLPGHVAVLLPEGTIAQAGRRNYVGVPLKQGFGQLAVKFFVQVHGGSHNP